MPETVDTTDETIDETVESLGEREIASWITFPQAITFIALRIIQFSAADVCRATRYWILGVVEMSRNLLNTDLIILP